MISNVSADPGCFWSMLEAFGTISASIIALYFGLKPIREETKNKPNLNLEYLYDNTSELHIWNLSNIGKNTALNVNLKITSIKDNKNIEYVSPDESEHHILNCNNIQNGDTKPIHIFTSTGEGLEFTFLHKKSETFHPGDETHSGIKHAVFLITADNVTASTHQYEFQEGSFYEHDKFMEVSTNKLM